MKQEGPEHILQAIRKVLAGKVFVSERMAELLLDSMSAGSTRIVTFAPLWSPTPDDVVGRCRVRWKKVWVIDGESCCGASSSNVNATNTHVTHVKHTRILRWRIGAPSEIRENPTFVAAVPCA
jgi:hypothetical protein